VAGGLSRAGFMGKGILMVPMLGRVTTVGRDIVGSGGPSSGTETDAGASHRARVGDQANG
jgi:hypothetical protein